MSDPLSIAASVTGLVAFGLKTCTAVTSYLDAFKSSNQEVESAKQQAQGMYNLLATVEKSIAKISPIHQSSTSAVRTCIATCEKEVVALESLVSELQGSTSGSHDSRITLSMKEQGQKLTYAFHRSRLEKLQAQLAKVIGTLQTALQVAGLDVAVGIESTIMTMQQSTLPNIQEQLDNTAPQIMANAAQLTDKILEKTRLIEDVFPLLKDLACDQKKQLELISYQQAVGRLIAKPSQLRKLCQMIDDQTSNTISNDTTLPGPVSQSITPPGGKTDHLELFQPLHSSCLSFSTSFGAGGFSLSPKFTYYPSVDSSTAPVFRIFNMLHWFLNLFPWNADGATETWTATFLEFVDLCIADIILLYRDGKAAPKAIDDRGRSVMHHLTQSKVRQLLEA
ncbi:hypothetical protein J7T55_010841 [Diaporthe amygdali]|uniref:uncharacterized protein n=1 Tax=Phomopsis amygdali TaxID=1214568 RepID=UPI0022FDDC65|nr:uncharacterized protein J7T55_010841 [Diaporthe amygdali]KAJ0114451.1 hypothetical protein J7T55_010841 [Diaporthe amygdali]